MNAVIDSKASQDYLVADLALAAWGRKELTIAEPFSTIHRMPDFVLREESLGEKRNAVGDTDKQKDLSRQ